MELGKVTSGFAGFTGRHPLFALAAVAVGCVLVADQGWIWGVLLALVLAGTVWWAMGEKRAIACLLCGLVAVGSFSLQQSRNEEAGRSLIGHGETMTAVMLADGQGERGLWSGPAELRSGAWKGTCVWWEGHGQELPVAGSVVTARGNFESLKAPRNPEEFDEMSWRRRKGMVAVFDGHTLRIETGKWPVLGAKIRSGFREAVTAGLPEDSGQAKVIRAIVIGESPSDADELITAFRDSGTLHIFSVSGMHVAMVGGIGWFVLRRLGLSRRKAVLLILPLVFGYSWISGNSAPAVRSAWMMAVFLLAFVFRRRPDLLNALGAVLLVAAVWDGNLLFQPGVQLSYGVVAAIAVGTSPATKWFAFLAKKEEYLPDDLLSGWQGWWLGVRKKFALGLGASSAAWIGSTPLTIWHFGTVTPIAMLGTFVLGPIVYVLMCLALISAAVYPLAPAAAMAVNRLNGKVADACVYSAEKLAAIPGAHFGTHLPGKPALLVYDLEYGAGASCFSSGTDGAVLIDCGDPRSFRRCVIKSLRGLGIQPDSVVLSHPDGGHLGGGQQVWETFPIRQALLPVELARSKTYQSWVEDAPKAGINILFADEVPSLPMPDGAKLEVLYAPERHGQNMLADERVAIFRLDWRGWKVLFTSDAGVGIESKLIASGKDLSADVIIAGKHRRDASLGDEFLDAVKPKAIVASHADFPKEERLKSTTVDYWKSRGIGVMNQGQTGGVTIHIDRQGDLLLEGFVDHSLIRLRR